MGHAWKCTFNNYCTYRVYCRQCLWKKVRLLPTNVTEMNLSQVLLDIHTFLKEHPYHVWKTRPDNTPLRTIKTILHSLAKLKGNDVSSVLLWVKVSRVSFGVQYNVLQLVRLCHFLLRFLPLTPTPPTPPLPQTHTRDQMVGWISGLLGGGGGGVIVEGASRSKVGSWWTVS